MGGSLKKFNQLELAWVINNPKKGEENLREFIMEFIRPKICISISIIDILNRE